MESLTLADGAIFQRLRIVADDAHAGRIARRVIDEEWFASEHRETLDIEYGSVGQYASRLERSSPFHDEQQRARLDERGLIRVGATLEPGMLLASGISLPSPFDPANKPPLGMQFVEDESLYAPAVLVGGVVTAVRHLTGKQLPPGTPKTVDVHIEVYVEQRRGLQVGDVLLIDGEPLVVSGVVDALPGDADLAVSSLLGPLLGLSPGEVGEFDVAKGLALARNTISARATGVYSLITRRPLRRSHAQMITTSHVRWLRERGLDALLNEFVALKSDDIHRHEWLPQSKPAAGGWQLEPAHPPTPESLRVACAQLEALGLRVELEPGDGCTRLRARPWLDDELRETSGGAITKPETINYRTLLPEPKGLFAPEVFGDEGLERRGPHGHFELGARIVPAVYRFGAEPLLPQLLGIAPRDLERVLYFQAGVLLEGDEIRFTEFDANNEPSGEDYLGAGADAVAALLARLPAERLPPGLRDRLAGITPSVLAVMAADFRPLVLLNSGNFATADSNDLYRRVINRANRLRKLVELKAPPVILANERRQLQQSVDQLHANSLLRSRERVLGSNDRPLKDIVELLVEDEPGKRVDFSGAGRMVIDSSVSPLEVGLPEAIFDTLLCDREIPVLLTMESGSAFLARQPRRHTDPVMRVHPSVAEQLGIDTEPVEIAVHRPLTPAGIAEARRLLASEPDIVREVPERSAWCEVDSSPGVMTVLSRLVASGDAASFDSPAGLLLAGIGSVDLHTSRGLPALPQAERRLMPIS